MWLLMIFVLVPLIEIALFIKVGGWLTLWPTLGIVLATGIIGTILVRRQGLDVLRQLQASGQGIGNPLSPLAHGVLILFAGAFLLTPGFFTDAVGFLLLVPQIRSRVIAALAQRVTVQTFGSGGFGQTRAGATGQRGQGPTVIDGEFYELDDEDDAATRPLGGRGTSGWTRH